MEGVGESQTTWKNMLAAFRSQLTQIDKLMSDTNACSENLKDPRHEMDAKEARKLVGPIQRKLGLVNNYVDSLHAILPLAAVTEDVWTEPQQGTKISEHSWTILRSGKLSIQRRNQSQRRQGLCLVGAQVAPEQRSSRV